MDGITKWGAFIKLSHTVFALPFALASMSAAARENRGWPGLRIFLLIIAAVFPLLTGVVVRSFAWLIILGKNGILNSTLQALGLISEPFSMLYSEGAVIVDRDGHKLGVVTSGTLGPTVDQPVAMAYLPVDHAIVAHEVYAEVRGKRLPMRVSAMPFAPHRYFRG